MRVLVFAEKRLSAIRAVVLAAANLAWVTVARSEKSFDTALRRCLNGETLIVFFVRAGNDMAFLEEKAREFMDMKLIIYLEEKNLALRERAYRLHPSLVTGSGDCKDLLPGMVTGLLYHLKCSMNHESRTTFYRRGNEKNQRYQA